MILGVIIFVVLSYLLAIIVDIIAYFRIGSVQWYVSPEKLAEDKKAVYGVLWGVIRMCMPTISVVIVLLVQGIDPVQAILSYINFSLLALLAYFLSPLIVFGVLGIYYILARIFNLVSVESKLEEEFRSAWGFKGIFLLAYSTAITMNAIVSLGEEIGWRGYLLSELSYLGFLESALIIGVIWGLWHASAIILLNFNIPSGAKYYSKLTVTLAFTLTLIIMSISINLVVLEVNSILPALAIHGAVNAIWGLTILISKNRCEITGMGLLAALSWSIISIILIALLFFFH